MDSVTQVFLIIRWISTSIFTDAKSDNTASDIKQIIEEILEITPEDQKLVFEVVNRRFEDGTIADYIGKGSCGMAYNPAVVLLNTRMRDGTFSAVLPTPLLSPEELPHVMKKDSGMTESSGSTKLSATLI